MTTTTKYFAQVSDGMTRNTIGKVEAETMDGILAGAWQLNRYTESPIDIYGPSDDPDVTEHVKLGTLRIDWVD